MAQQVGVISNRRLAQNPAMEHERPSFARRVCDNNTNGVDCGVVGLGALCVAVSGLFTFMAIDCRNSHESGILTGLLGSMAAAGYLMGGGILLTLTWVACGRPQWQRWLQQSEIELAEIEARDELDARRAENRV